MAAAQS